MFSGLKKKIGGGLALVGFILLIGMAGADDVTVASGIHTPMVSLIFKGILFLAMMGTGAVLLGGANESNR